MLCGLMIYCIISGVLVFLLCRFYSKGPSEKWTCKNYIEAVFTGLIGSLIITTFILVIICAVLGIMIEKILDMNLK